MVDDKKDAKILIIDDNETELDLLEAILMRLGFQKIRKALSAEEAIGLTKEQPPDLFFIDIIMPGMTGGEFRELLKENATTKDIPVIFISGIISKQEERLMRGRLKSGDIIVAKPFSIREIAEVVTESLKKNIRHDEPVEEYLSEQQR